MNINNKAEALLSDRLDSTLAEKLRIDRGIDVTLDCRLYIVDVTKIDDFFGNYYFASLFFFFIAFLINTGINPNNPKRTKTSIICHESISPIVSMLPN